jgi:hypothetical protein
MLQTLHPDPALLLKNLSSGDALDPRSHVGLWADGILPIKDLAADTATLVDWLEDELREVPGADSKLAAASLVGSVAWSVCRTLGYLHLAGLGGAIGSADVALSRRRVPWEEDGECGVATIYDTTVRHDLSWTSFPDAADLGRTVTTVHAPLVEATHRQSRLSKGALWRLVGDSLSGALLELGKSLGEPERAMAVARAILDDRSSPLRSRQTSFVRIEVPEIRTVTGEPLAEWFRARGGCCRYYTSEGGEYCTTCVLRDPESRDARLTDYLRRIHAA